MSDACIICNFFLYGIILAGIAYLTRLLFGAVKSLGATQAITVIIMVPYAVWIIYCLIALQTIL